MPCLLGYTSLNNTEVIMGKWVENEAKMQHAVREQIIKALWDKIQLTGKDEKTPEEKFAVQMQKFDILKKVLGLIIVKNEQYVETEESKSFDNAIRAGNFNVFNEFLQKASNDTLAEIQNGEHLSLMLVDSGNPTITADDINDLKEYLQEKKIVASVSIANKGNTFVVDPNQLGANPVFSIHSVAKVFTGVLLMKLINEGIINEKDLDLPISLDKRVLDELSEQVQERLQKTTLRQIMLHESGLGNYLDNKGGLADVVTQKLNKGEPAPNITSSFELLKYGDKEVLSPLGQFNYSNLGMLLLGFAIEKKYHDAQKGRKEQPLLTIDDLMQRFAKNDVKMSVFESKRPENGIYNQTDQRSPKGPLSVKNPKYIQDFISARFACTAGGYWTTNQDLQKFGQWIKDECQRSPRFEQLIKDHGSEFYNAEKQAVEHSGLHADTAHFYTSLRNGTVITILSPQGDRAATNLADTILKQTTWFKLLSPSNVQPDVEIHSIPKPVSTAYRRSIAAQNTTEQLAKPELSSSNRKLDNKK